MNQKQENVESLAGLPPRTMLQEMGGVMQGMTLDVTHALKSSLETDSSAISQRLLLDQTTLLTTLRGKYELRVSLELYKVP